ncbi:MULTISPECIES: hypothetical protein [Thalassobacillus]|uniref:hypothetical protein n=1 Tax=Thalassobacillus TaxID=331971 RepID=UPI000A1CA898|nr:hypothetical protein [Thalassobacillus devorans]
MSWGKDKGCRHCDDGALRPLSRNMFVLIRCVNGATETLKATNSHLFKTFSDFTAAHAMAQKLNVHTKGAMHWDVKHQKQY